MPYQTTFDARRRLAIVVGSGPNDRASSIEAMEALSSDPRLGPDFGILFDSRENSYTPSASEARDLTDAYLARFRDRPLALVVAGLLQYGVGNMIATLFELRGKTAAVFRDRAEAEEWLTASIRETA